MEYPKMGSCGGWLLGFLAAAGCTTTTPASFLAGTAAARAIIEAIGCPEQCTRRVPPSGITTLVQVQPTRYNTGHLWRQWCVASALHECYDPNPTRALHSLGVEQYVMQTIESANDKANENAVPCSPPATIPAPEFILAATSAYTRRLL